MDCRGFTEVRQDQAQANGSVGPSATHRDSSRLGVAIIPSRAGILCVLACAILGELYNVAIMDSKPLPSDIDACHQLIAKLQSRVGEQATELGQQATE